MAEPATNARDRRLSRDFLPQIVARVPPVGLELHFLSKRRAVHRFSVNNGRSKQRSCQVAEMISAGRKTTRGCDECVRNGDVSSWAARAPSSRVGGWEATRSECGMKPLRLFRTPPPTPPAQPSLINLKGQSSTPSLDIFSASFRHNSASLAHSGRKKKKTHVSFFQRQTCNET